jgi:hypothetical protein
MSKTVIKTFHFDIDYEGLFNGWLPTNEEINEEEFLSKAKQYCRNVTVTFNEQNPCIILELDGGKIFHPEVMIWAKTLGYAEERHRKRGIKACMVTDSDEHYGSFQIYFNQDQQIDILKHYKACGKRFPF